MLKKSLLYSALAITAFNPLALCAASQTETHTTKTDTSVTTTTEGDVAPASTGTTTSTTMNDSAITEQVKALFQKNTLLGGKNIAVETKNHQVMLSGKVDTDMEYERAVSLAESVQGVNEVNADNLVVKDSKSPLADTYITAKVKGSLMKEKLFGDKEIEYWPVTVETKNGVVYLAGTVDTDAQRNNIVSIVEKVKGVKSVKSALTTGAKNTESDAGMTNQDNNEMNKAKDSTE